MRIAIDSASYDAIAAYNWPHKIGYFNGPESAWTPEQIGDASARGQLLALVDVLGNAPHAASILDWERGDVQNGDVLREWVQARNKFRGDAVVYCNRESLTTVINALQSERCLIWLAEPTPNHEPPPSAPVLGLPPNLTLLGIQYALSPESGGNYDISVLYDEAWHASYVHREDLAAVAAGELEPRAGIDQPASTPTETADNLQDPPAAGPAPAPSPPTAGSAASSVFSPALPRPIPAGALSSSPDPVSAPSSPTMTPPTSAASPQGFRVPPGLLSLPGAAAGPAVAAPSAPETSSIADIGVSAAPAMPSAASPDPAPPAPAPATGPAAPTPAATLPHGWISAVLADVRQVATQFRSAGQHQPARMLEEAAAAAVEAGSLLQKAGL